MNREKKTRLLALAALFILCLGPAAAQPPERMADEDMKTDKPEQADKMDVPKAEDKLVTTQHRAVIGGKEVRYTATAGTLVLRDEDGKPRASMFFVAYTRDGVTDRSKRPVTYTYNGGPGSSSVWLHLGAFGPRRVEAQEEGMALPPPYRLVDNGESLLDVTDLVFIDPVTTGYSRAIPGRDAKKFYGVKEDAETMAEFIRLWTVRFGRWSSPKFLAGESYGTTRSARLSNLLQDQHGMYLNGVILISSILNFQTARFAVGNDLPYPLFLPTYTAAAWYHKRLPQDLQAGGLQKAVEEAKRFAMGEYTLALMQGNDLGEQGWNDIAAKVARYTGLSPDYVKRTNLRPEIQAFVKELLRDQRTTVGRLDSRFKGVDRDAAGESNEFDPSYAAIQGPYTATFNDYVSQDLGFKSDLPYEILTDRVRPWSYNEFSNQYVNVAEDLRVAMSQNPALKVFVGNGYYDLATPFFATEYTFDHIGFEPDYKRRVTMHYYEAGHMMYVRRVDREQLKKDVAAFIAAAVP
ncbi:MAG TPA: peptidase S10 [Thermoanaerobaculia bacterium]|nr:peptidase S10 [Thermoanaerobaculia bacterium]